MLSRKGVPDCGSQPSCSSYISLNRTNFVLFCFEYAKHWMGGSFGQNWGELQHSLNIETSNEYCVIEIPCLGSRSGGEVENWMSSHTMVENRLTVPASFSLSHPEENGTLQERSTISFVSGLLTGEVASFSRTVIDCKTMAITPFRSRRHKKTLGVSEPVAANRFLSIEHLTHKTATFDSEETTHWTKRRKKKSTGSFCNG